MDGLRRASAIDDMNDSAMNRSGLESASAGIGSLIKLGTTSACCASGKQRGHRSGVEDVSSLVGAVLVDASATARKTANRRSASPRMGRETFLLGL